MTIANIRKAQRRAALRQQGRDNHDRYVRRLEEQARREGMTEPTFQLPPQVRDELARLVWLATHDKEARR